MIFCRLLIWSSLFLSLSALAMQYELVQTLYGHPASNSRLSFSFDNKYLLSQDNLGNIRVTDLDSGKIIFQRLSFHEKYPVEFIAGSYKFVMQESATDLLIIDAISKEQIPLKSQSKIVEKSSFSISPCRQYLLQSYTDGIDVNYDIIKWDIATASPMELYKGQSHCYFKGGEFGVGSNKMICLLSSDGSEAPKVMKLDGFFASFDRLKFLSDTQKPLMVCEQEGEVVVYDLRAQERIRSYNKKGLGEYHFSAKGDLIFKRPNKSVILPSKNGLPLKIKNIKRTLKKTETISFENEGIYPGMFTGHTNIVIKPFKFYSAQNGQLLQNLNEDPELTQVVNWRFSPDGSYWATGHEPGEIKIWQLKDGATTIQ